MRYVVKSVPDLAADVVSSLSSCRHLKKLVLLVTWSCDMSRRAWVSFWAIIAEHISQLCTAIRSIELQLFIQNAATGFVDTQDAFLDGIEVLEPVFEQEALANLQHVVFDFAITCWYKGNKAPEAPITLEKFEDAIQAKLPKLRKRGIAQVRYKFEAFNNFCECLIVVSVDSSTTSS